MTDPIQEYEMCESISVDEAADGEANNSKDTLFCHFGYYSNVAKTSAGGGR